MSMITFLGPILLGVVSVILLVVLLVNVAELATQTDSLSIDEKNSYKQQIKTTGIVFGSVTVLALLLELYRYQNSNITKNSKNSLYQKILTGRI